MSMNEPDATGLRRGATDDTRPLDDREWQQVQRLFSDPFSFPLEFKTWLKGFIETADITLPASVIRDPKKK